MFKMKGDRPMWATVYDHIAGMSIGDVIKDDELFALLPDSPEASIRSAFWRAVEEVERSEKRTFDRVRLTGYRMVDSGEHERLARKQHRSARRRMGAARRKLHSADRSRLTPDQRRRIDALEDHVATQQDMIRRIDTRVERTERGLRDVRREHRTETAEMSERVERMASQLAELHERLGFAPSPVVAPNS